MLLLLAALALAAPVDADGDGYTSSDAGGDDCDDSRADVHPGGMDIAYDGVDQDCVDGDEVDIDDDGYDGLGFGDGDCADQDAAIHPGATEIDCDGVDQDCDGQDPCPREDAAADTGSGALAVDEGCASAPAPTSAGLALLAVLLVRRRR